MKHVKLVEHPDLCVPTICFLNMHRDHAPVPEGLNIIKPMNKLTKLARDWDDSVVWSCIEKLAKCLEDEFLIHCGSP